jgi:capsular polysaccharide biosynthesis protein
MFDSPIKKVAKNWKAIIIVGLICGIISALASFIFPLEYRADAQVLIISKTRSGVDPYTVVKSAERVGENLVQIMRTSDFYAKVMAQPGYSIDKSRFDSVSEKVKRERWIKTIEASVVYGTGVLNLSAYSADKEQARQLAAASADALINYGWEYVGGDMTMKIINDPVVTKWPARPNVAKNAVLGFLAGMLILSGFILIKK